MSSHFVFLLVRNRTDKCEMNVFQTSFSAHFNICKFANNNLLMAIYLKTELFPEVSLKQQAANPKRSKFYEISPTTFVENTFREILH